jgi:hypothetical protein
VDLDITGIIPGRVARQYLLVPIDKIGNNLTLAMSNPLNVQAIEDVELLSGCSVQTFVSTSSDIKRAIEKYYKDKEYFSDYVSYSKFIKGVERLVRNSKEYSAFISYVVNTLGMNYCQVFPNIKKESENSKVEIELHHGPIFTLYDVCACILNWFLDHGYKVNTMRVAKKVIDEHYAMRVQFIRLSVTAHEGVHNRDIFTHLNQGIGDIDTFIKLYGDSFDDEQKYKIWSYINMCEANPSFDRGVLDVEAHKKYVNL